MQDDNTSIPFTISHAKMLTDIHGALVGNPALGNPGLVARVEIREQAHETLKAKVESHDRKIWLVSLMFGALWTALVTFKNNLIGK